MNEELKEALAKFDKGVEDLKAKTADKAGKKELTEGLETLKTELNASIEKIKSEGKEATEEVNKQLLAKLDLMEKAITAQGKGKSNEGQEIVDAYKKECDAYLRKGKTADSEVVENFHNFVIGKQLTFLSDDNRKSMVKTAMGEEGMYLVEKTLQVQVPEDGGILVPQDRKSTFSERMFETSNVRPVADVMTISGDSLEIVIDDEEGVSGGWVGETQTRPTTGTPQIGLLTIPMHEQYAQPVITQKMLDDAGIDIAGWLTKKTNAKLLRVENSAYINGDGTKKPKGILTYGAWSDNDVYERNALQTVNITNASASKTKEFDWTSIYDMVTQLQSDYDAKAEFRMHKKTWAGIVKMTDTTGAPLLKEGLIQDGAEKRLFGYRVGLWSDMTNAFSGASGAIASGVKAILFGDFSSYQIIDKPGIRVIRDNITDKGKVKFYTTKRTGGELNAFDRLIVGLTTVTS